MRLSALTGDCFTFVIPCQCLRASVSVVRFVGVNFESLSPDAAVR